MTICGHDHFDIGRLVKAVHLIQELEQNTLDLNSIHPTDQIEMLEINGHE